MNYKKIVLYIIIFLIIVFLGNYLFIKKYIQPKLVNDVIEKLQKNIDENYSQRLDNLIGQVRSLDSKINNVDKKRQEIAKDVADLKRQRQNYTPPANLQEAVKLLKERGYEVTIKN